MSTLNLSPKMNEKWFININNYELDYFNLTRECTLSNYELRILYKRDIAN